MQILFCKKVWRCCQTGKSNSFGMSSLTGASRSKTPSWNSRISRQSQRRREATAPARKQLVDERSLCWRRGQPSVLLLCYGSTSQRPDPPLHSTSWHNPSLFKSAAKAAQGCTRPMAAARSHLCECIERLRFLVCSVQSDPDGRLFVALYWTVDGSD